MKSPLYRVNVETVKGKTLIVFSSKFADKAEAKFAEYVKDSEQPLNAAYWLSITLTDPTGKLLKGFPV